MGAPQEILEEIFTVIEGGSEVGTSAEIIQFPSDNGQETFSAIQRTIKGSNGTGMNYWVAAVANGASAISAGALFLTCTFPEFIALAVPCLGIAVGTIWYNMAPEFWNGVSDKLVNAGYTYKGKIVSYMNTEGNLTFPKGAVEILANDLIDAGVFVGAQTTLDPEEQSILFYPNQYQYVNLEEGLADHIAWLIQTQGGLLDRQAYFTNRTGSRPIRTGMMLVGDGTNYTITPIAVSKAPFSVDFKEIITPTYITTDTLTGVAITRNDITYYCAVLSSTINYRGTISISSKAVTSQINYTANCVWDIMYIMEHGDYNPGNSDLLQKDATYPQLGIPWADLFPDWIPWEFPLITIGSETFRLPDGYPVEYPINLPEEQPYQKEAQEPGNNAEEAPDTVADNITDPEHDPRTEQGTEPETGVDTDTGSEDPQNIEEREPGTTPDPPEPDPEPDPTPVIPIPTPPASVSANKMFTVYNPSSSQLDQLGGYLWDDNLIETLKRIWQNPMDGIIGLSQVYCTPVTGGTHNIILGYLDSGVSSAVVTNQFAHIDCGEITIDEVNNNATDYNPYTAIQLYLPFIGITELDVNEFMGGKIAVKYHIDVYTGTCLAEVKMKRTRDVPNGGIVYTFTGNCSQQLPLTSGDQKGLLSALIGAAGVGIGIASGGAVIAASGMSAAAASAATSRLAGNSIAGEVERDASREMMHVSHSGNLSANAGIMGQKKPYVIIRRQKPYNANNYNKFYGFPTNKTVFLSNYSGFAKVKAARLKSKATEIEKAEIMELCMAGIIM